MSAMPAPEGTATHVHRTTCRLCGSGRLAKVLPLPTIPVGDDYRPESALDEPQPALPTDLYLCGECGLAQMVDVVDPDILYAHMIYRTAISLGLPEHFQGYAADLLSRSGKGEGALVVDIGSNDGTLLKAFKALGLRVLGVEPSPPIAAEANTVGIETLCRYFGPEVAREVTGFYGPAGLVTCNNTFANIDDLDAFTRGLAALLGPDGVLAIESGYLLDVVEHGLFDNVYHEHLSYFAVKPLVPFFRRHGLEVFDVLRVPTKGGSLRLLIQPVGAGRPVCSRVAELVALEDAKGLDDPATYAAMDRRLEAAKLELHRVLCELKAAGKRVVGYGASVGTTTFLARFEVAPFLDYLCDDNPAKFGLFSPGDRLLVRPSADLYEDRPDVVLVCAWRYADPIEARHTRFRAEGGRFLHPWPAVVLA